MIDLLVPVTQRIVGAALISYGAPPWFSLISAAETAGSYDGGVVFALVAVIALLALFLVHRFAPNRTRRTAVWDGGYPFDAVSTQHAGPSFGMPIRRVFGASVFHIHKIIDMPILRTLGGVRLRLTQMQFVFVHLTLVFIGLMALLIVVAAWR